MRDLIALINLKRKILRNKVFSLSRESNLKVIVILLFIVGYAVGSFLFLWHGIDYIAQRMGLGYFLIDKLFYLFFLVLFWMLAVSQLIITYSGFYKSKETGLLFSLPLSPQAVFTCKFLEATFLSSWAFVFLVAPLLLAYGINRSLGPMFYFRGLCLAVPFIFITAGCGTLVGLILVRIFTNRFKRLLISGALIIAGAAYIYYQWARRIVPWQSDDITLVVDQVLRHTRVGLLPIFPSYWLTKGLLNSNFSFNFLLLLSTALFAVWLCFRAGERWYYSSWQMLGGREKTRLYRPVIIARSKWETLILKDLKMFRRDPVQWSQFAVFFGIIMVYVLNLRQMNYDIESIFWKNLISYLNLGTIMLTLGVLCTRFIYPQWSLESRRMWILNLLPVGPGRILLLKYFVSSLLCIGITLPIMIVSNLMMKVSSYLAWLSISTIIIAGLALPALALGLGAVFPNSKEDDMAKIVSGFGGTLTLVLSLIYISFILGVEIIPIHLYYIKQAISKALFMKWMIATVMIIILASAAAVVLPLYLGWRSLKHSEY